jgi:conjugative transposon TraM protein
MKTQHTAKFLKRRKFMIVLPILVYLFITMAFWSMNGGALSKEKDDIKTSLNKNLPEAKVEAESLDKMSLYNRLLTDSTKIGVSDNQLVDNNSYPQVYGNGYSDPNETRIRDKLTELESIINQPDYPAKDLSNTYSTPNNQYKSTPDTDLSRIEAIMRAVSGDTNEDPEIRQLDNMLEKIKDIQNPERIGQKLKALSAKQKGKIFTVNHAQKQNVVGLLKSIQANASPSFFDFEEIVDVPDTISLTTIPAVVHETQTLVNGATIKMRLGQNIYVNGTLIPEGTFISGICSIEGERLKIEVSSIRYENTIYPIVLVVYDLDAIEGIRIPEAITRESAKEGADRAVQSLQLMSLDPSIATQTAAAGVETVKGFFSKKVKLVRVMVKAGHPVLLADQHAKY